MLGVPSRIRRARLCTSNQETVEVRTGMADSVYQIVKLSFASCSIGRSHRSLV